MQNGDLLLQDSDTEIIPVQLRLKWLVHMVTNHYWDASRDCSNNLPVAMTSSLGGQAELGAHQHLAEVLHMGQHCIACPIVVVGMDPLSHSPRVTPASWWAVERPRL
eukprot:CAMPEP_0202380190 /NCGR_PEP_ID=MMETSP1127-20130417/27556_1 /ASSEMBLY_ACC=CAM_ASM_000462 /TAXON_ID=3047 /ORGANISM="Dunaliella tertiolecta, Strain CCMP1320" /LENGTH=106 /DNA_ID=CAMNT_0048978847 /DNA_START=1297 /DNA_END=1617 /DNA_ORIENTATION=+